MVLGSGIRDPRSGIRDPGSEIRDPGSEIRDPEKTYSGSRIQGSKSTRSRIPDPDPQHWTYQCFFKTCDPTLNKFSSTFYEKKDRN